MLSLNHSFSRYSYFLKLLILGLFLMALGQNVFAHSETAAERCLPRLLEDGQRDSFSMDLDLTQEDVPDYGRDYMAQAVAAVRLTLKKKGCTRASVNFALGPDRAAKSRCYRFNPDEDFSVACYVETNLGYFFVTRDMLTTLHITFSRWD